MDASPYLVGVCCLCVVAIPSLLYCNRRRRGRRKWAEASLPREDKDPPPVLDTTPTAQEEGCEDTLQTSLLAMSLGGSPNSSHRNGSWLKSLKTSQLLSQSCLDSSTPPPSPTTPVVSPSAVTTAPGHTPSFLQPPRLKLPNHPYVNAPAGTFKQSKGRPLTQPPSDYSAPSYQTWRGRNGFNSPGKLTLRHSRLGLSRRQVMSDGKLLCGSLVPPSAGAGGKATCRFGWWLVLCLLASVAANLVLIIMYMHR